MMKNRILSFVLAVVMVFSCIGIAPVHVHAAETPTVSLVGPEEAVDPGSTVTVTVKIENNPGVNAMAFFVTWDEELTHDQNEAEQTGLLTTKPSGVSGTSNDFSELQWEYDETTGEDAPVRQYFYWDMSTLYKRESGKRVAQNVYGNGDLASMTFTVPTEGKIGALNVFFTEAEASDGTVIGFQATATTGEEGDNYLVDFENVDAVIKIKHTCEWETEGTVTKEATCTVDGEKTYKCVYIGCTETKVEAIAAAHTWGEWTSSDATCTVPGGLSRTCSVCGEVESQDGAQALGHLFCEDTDGTCGNCVYTAPGCETDGSIVRTCQREGCTETTTVVLDKTGHTYCDHTEENAECEDCTYTAPDCDTAGSITYNCTVCGEAAPADKTVTIPALGHTYCGHETNVPTCEYCVYVGATCEAEGSITYKCTVCGEDAPADVNKVLPVDEVNGHRFSESTLIKPATCTTPGTVGGTCAICGETTQSEDAVKYPALGHNYSNEITTAPTCEADGVKTYTCANDGCPVKTYTESVAALGHAYNAGVVTTAPTREAEGVKTFTCANDGCPKPTYTEAVPATGHNYTSEITTAPTCKTEGVKTYTCANEGCPKPTYTEAVPVLEHVMDEGVVTTAPTCTDKGVKTYTCTLGCGHTTTEEIAALGHDVPAHSETCQDCEYKAPTCTEDGYHNAHCGRCGEVIAVVLEKLGHDYKGEVITQVSCTVDGEVKFTCAVCGDTYNQTYEAFGHSYEAGVCLICGESDPDYVDVKFVDVAEKAWYTDSVYYVARRGLMNGVGNNMFNPNGTMTRAMVVTVLWRYAGSPEGGENGFSDVAADTWYTEAIAWASANDIVNGVGGGKFNPNGTITREQFAAIIYRYSKSIGVDVSGRADLSGFSDNASVSPYAVEAMAWAVDAGLINGVGSKTGATLSPAGYVTRAQAATILARFVENVG